jgi:hypothetical protein
MVGDPVVVQSCLRNPGVADTMSLSSQPFAQAVQRQESQPKQQLHSEAEKVYQLRMMELHLKVQSLEKALEESICFSMQVETELENEISDQVSDCKSRHTGEHVS